jgi:hypothetical protein
VLDQATNFKAVLNRDGRVAFVPEQLLTSAHRVVCPPGLGLPSHTHQREATAAGSHAAERSVSDVLMASYYHGPISRNEAEARFKVHGLEEGSYLLRLKDEDNEVYALSVCSSGIVEHHLLQVCVL